MRHILILLAAFIVLSAPVMARAQDNAGNENEANYQQRLALAERMHEIRPLEIQVQAAIESIAQRYPEGQRELFVQKMMQTFQQDRLRTVSIEAMADTFTVAELEKMISYFGSEEGQAIMEKMPVYQAFVQPELMKLIDRAMMELRTGTAGDVPQGR